MLEGGLSEYLTSSMLVVISLGSTPRPPRIPRREPTPNETSPPMPTVPARTPIPICASAAEGRTKASAAATAMRDLFDIDILFVLAGKLRCEDFRARNIMLNHTKRKGDSSLHESFCKHLSQSSSVGPRLPALRCRIICPS